MLLNQLLYTLPPVRLKDTLIAPFASTATNTVLRIASCCVLIGNIFLVPTSVYLFMYIAGMCTYLMYKAKTVPASILAGAAGLLLAYILINDQINF